MPATLQPGLPEELIEIGEGHASTDFQMHPVHGKTASFHHQMEFLGFAPSVSACSFGSRLACPALAGPQMFGHGRFAKLPMSESIGSCRELFRHAAPPHACSFPIVYHMSRGDGKRGLCSTGLLKSRVDERDFTVSHGGAEMGDASGV